MNRRITVDSKRLSLALFFTAGTGIGDWAEHGTLDRELAVYRRILPELDSISLITYGGRKDAAYSERFSDFNICPVGWRRRQVLTALETVFRHSNRLGFASVFKTNQIRGAQIPVWLKQIYGKKLIARCGFLHSYFTERQTDDTRRIEEAEALEKKVFDAADTVVVTSDWQREYVLDRYGSGIGEVAVVPNYVDTDLMRPMPELERRYDLVYVGRATGQKNLFNLFQALDNLRRTGTDASILMIGTCSESDELTARAASLDLQVEFAGRIESGRLPGLLNQARIFILPSHYEGHPKSLLEAMSCGLPCIGTNVAGIREEIDNGCNGMLCEPDPESLAGTIGLLLKNDDLRAQLGAKARRYICERYSLDRISAMELELIDHVYRR